MVTDGSPASIVARGEGLDLFMRSVEIPSICSGRTSIGKESMLEFARRAEVRSEKRSIVDEIIFKGIEPLKFKKAHTIEEVERNNRIWSRRNGRNHSIHASSKGE